MGESIEIQPWETQGHADDIITYERYQIKDLKTQGPIYQKHKQYSHLN